MKCRLFLKPQAQALSSENVTIPLTSTMPSFSSTNIALTTLVEDAAYTGEVELEHVDQLICAIRILLNGREIGLCDLSTLSIISKHQFLPVKFNENFFGAGFSQPFLLQYDLVLLSVQIQFQNQEPLNFFSNYMLCVSKRPEDTQNIEAMIKELLEFDDDRLNYWLFSSNTKRDITNSLLEGSWKYKSQKSVSSYIQMLEEICSCYKINLPYFQNHAKHVIMKEQTLVPYQQVRTITSEGFSWLIKNSNHLVTVPQQTAINYCGSYYLPLRMQSDEHKKDWNVYENQVVLGFLGLVCESARIIASGFAKDIIDEERILQRLHRIAQDGYKAPIITIKDFMYPIVRHCCHV